MARGKMVTEVQSRGPLTGTHPPPSHPGGVAEAMSGHDPRQLRDAGCLPPGQGE